MTPIGVRATPMGVVRERATSRRGVAGPRFLRVASDAGLIVTIAALGGCEAAQKGFASFRNVAENMAAASEGEYAHAKLQRMGRPVRPKDVSGCAPAMARINGFCIDRFEASVVEVSLSKFEIPHPASEQLKPGVRYEARSLGGAFPQAYINREQAADACKNAGKRLCSVSEWFEACRGSRRLQYPYAREFIKDKSGACRHIEVENNSYNF